MNKKIFMLLVTIGATLALVSLVPARAYVPSADELSLVVGGDDWTLNKKCEAHLRCTGTFQDCPFSNCEGKEVGDACGSYTYYYDRDGCEGEDGYKCKYDACASKIKCVNTQNCECKAWGLNILCRVLSDNDPTEVYPCTDQEM